MDTPTGQIAVEALKVGDTIRTSDGKDVELRWVGNRKITRFEIKRDPDLRPVRISAGALGNSVPSRDLWVSPNHKILVRDWRAELLFSEEEVLVPAKALIDGGHVIQDTSVNETEYFHLLFENHEIILTEGAPTESFFPGPYSLRMLVPEKRAELLELFPDLLDVGYGDFARPCLTPKEGRFLRPSAGKSEQIEPLRRIA